MYDDVGDNTKDKAIQMPLISLILMKILITNSNNNNHNGDSNNKNNLNDIQ